MEIGVVIVRVPLGVDDGAVEPDARTDRLDDVIRPLRELILNGRVHFHAVEVANPLIIHLIIRDGHDVVFEAFIVKPMPADAPHPGEISDG